MHAWVLGYKTASCILLLFSFFSFLPLSLARHRSLYLSAHFYSFPSIRPFLFLLLLVAPLLSSLSFSLHSRHSLSNSFSNTCMSTHFLVALTLVALLVPLEAWSRLSRSQPRTNQTSLLFYPSLVASVTPFSQS